MLALISILATSLLARVAVAQAPTTNFSLTSVIQNVNLGTRNSWCIAEQNSCSILCGAAASNSCTGEDLNYVCTCQSNNSAPALQYYDQTILSFVCQWTLGDCMAKNANNLQAQKNCNSTYVCGNVKPSTPATTSSAAPSSTQGPSATSASASAASATASKTSNAGMQFAREYGVGAFAAGMMAVLGLAL